MKNYLYLASVCLSLSLMDQSVQAMYDDEPSHSSAKSKTTSNQNQVPDENGTLGSRWVSLATDTGAFWYGYISGQKTDEFAERKLSLTARLAYLSWETLVPSANK